MKKVLIAVAVLAVIAAFIGVNMKKQKNKGVEVSLETVETRDLTEMVSATGKIQPKISVDISADITGKIVEVAVEEGDAVDPGDLLLRIDPTQFREALRSAEAQHQSTLASLDEAAASLEQQELEWRRARSL
ncbi:MAG: biotin/lipoyl-binding protein, partial [Actinomycetia bacterium]|nr:biotin/lipoyl-binding protein [Actinomycetes bacterium]